MKNCACVEREEVTSDELAESGYICGIIDQSLNIIEDEARRIEAGQPSGSITLFKIDAELFVLALKRLRHDVVAGRLPRTAMPRMRFTELMRS